MVEVFGVLKLDFKIGVDLGFEEVVLGKTYHLSYFYEIV